MAGRENLRKVYFSGINIKTVWRNNPERQGLQSAPFGEGDSLNITQEEPGFVVGEVLYSPDCDIHLVVWTEEAIENNERRRLTNADEIAGLFSEGLLLSGTPDSGVSIPSLTNLKHPDQFLIVPLLQTMGVQMNK